jgi:hypothetical protein
LTDNVNVFEAATLPDALPAPLARFEGAIPPALAWFEAAIVRKPERSLISAAGAFVSALRGLLECWPGVSGQGR